MIQRAEQFSPNSVDRDLAILETVGRRLQHVGCEVRYVSECLLKSPADVSDADAIMNMGRLPQVQMLLGDTGLRIINSPEGIRNCAREKVEETMRLLNIPAAPREGTDGYWLKRSDAAAQSKGDVVFAADKEALAISISEMEQRGIGSYIVSAHVKGDLVKFYGVLQTGFFRCYYPTDDGQTKYGDEQRNGKAHHYPYSAGRLQQEAERLAEALGIEIYGGDCIIRHDGSFCLIDFNDWPSFSRCREEAATAIASLIIK